MTSKASTRVGCQPILRYLEQLAFVIHVRPSSVKSFWQVLMALSILFRRVHRLLDALWPWNCF